ncbi:unnamed protein product [Meganyctiphanes norvegica]|uniref:Chitin-binding type-2 domain-containing protein n=1 Tax=Meganyctiphanes norvegica TaxID=48144 RepID=A0AAV2SKC1_MEGNR
MSRLQTLILVVSFILSDVSGTKDTCDPVCENADTFTADPYDCNSYFYCITPGTPSGPYLCPDGEIFDSTVKPNHDDYKKPCKKDTSPPCKAICETPTCQIVCKNTLDVIVDPMDCHVFYVCVPNENGSLKPHRDECPSDRPNFNGADCTSHEEDCCDVCNPSCVGKDYGETIPDPADCHKYFTCLGDGDNNVPGDCPAGHYDIETNDCAQGLDCINLCDNSTTTAVPITTLAPNNTLWKLESVN